MSKIIPYDDRANDRIDLLSGDSRMSVQQDGFDHLSGNIHCLSGSITVGFYRISADEFAALGEMFTRFAAKLKASKEATDAATAKEPAIDQYCRATES